MDIPKRTHPYMLGDSVLFGWKAGVWSEPDKWKSAYVTNATETMIEIEYKVLFWRRRKWITPYPPKARIVHVFCVVKTIF